MVEVEAQCSGLLIHLKLVYLLGDLDIVHSSYFSPMFPSFCSHLPPVYIFPRRGRLGRRQKCASYLPPLSTHIVCFFSHRNFCSQHIVACVKEVTEMREADSRGFRDDLVLLGPQGDISENVDCGRKLGSQLQLCCDTFLWWGDINKCKFTPERELKTKQSNAITKVQLGEPVSLLRFILGVWMRRYPQGEHRAERQSHYQKPMSAWETLIEAGSLEHIAELADSQAG